MIKAFIWLTVSFFVLVKPAQAYIDPGAGSYFIQIAIGSLLGGLYLIKRFWKSITAFAARLAKKLLGKS